MDDPLYIEPKLNKFDIVNIIRLYRSYPVLWDVKHKNYRRSELKAMAYEDIARKMNMTVESVKKKIKSLRSTYTGERRKMLLSKLKPDAQEYKIVLSWYNEMDFLDNLVSVNITETTLNETPEISHECEYTEILEEEDQISEPIKIEEDTRTISTQVFDTSKGKGAANVPIVLYRLLESEEWEEMQITTTDEYGHSDQLLDKNDFQSGIYKLKFDIYKYFIGQGKSCFYPFIEIVINCVAGERYHIPLQVSQYSYSTYKGIE